VAASQQLPLSHHWMPIDQCIIYFLHNFVWNGHILLVIMNFHFYLMVRREGQAIFKNENKMWFSISVFVHV
jgi:hypothetical protein